MIAPSPFRLGADAAWCVLGLVWLTAFVTRERRRESTDHRRNLALQFAASALLVVCFALLFGPRFPGLHAAGTPQAGWLGALGLALALLGVAFAIWARVTLGAHWAGLVMTVREGHELVQRGPYALVRHPIYSGMFAAIVGTALTVGTLASWLGAAAGLAGILIRVEIEERLMAAEFGEAHAAYRRRISRLIPFVW